MKFGIELILDLGKCNHRIGDSFLLRCFVEDLCKTIGMKAYKECHTEYFGLNSDITKGFSIFQFIETSCISGHFSDIYRTAHINIFTCKDLDVDAATEYCLKFFGAKLINKTILNRWIEKELE
jgi:S-adenosylmethionine decarboxylase